MPQGERSELTETTLAVAEALMSDIELVANELEAIPFMQEEVSREEYLRRLRAMTPDQRVAEARRMGLPAFFNITGGKNA